MKIYFEDYKLNEIVEIPPHLIEADEMINFAKLYDPRPMHLDEKAASKTQFKSIFASGLFTFSFAWGKYVEMIKDDSAIVAGMGIDDLSWIKPVYAGDTLRSTLEVIELVDLTPRNVGTIKIQFMTYNQKDELVLQAKVKWMSQKRK